MFANGTIQGLKKQAKYKIKKLVIFQPKKFTITITAATLQRHYQSWSNY